MNALMTLSAILPLSLTSGINLYATLIVAGLCIRFGWVQNTPTCIQVLASWPVIILAGLFYIIEFLADKIPFIDTLWDMAHTFIRPVGGAVLGVAILGKAEPIVLILGALAAGTVTLVSHGGKAGSRIALNVITPGENLTNTGVSIAEDVGVGALTFLALKYPLLGATVALIVLALIVIFIPRLMRWTWFTVFSFFSWMKFHTHKLLRKEIKSDILPSSHVGFFQHQKPEVTSICKAEGIKGANGRTGFVSILDGLLSFSYNTLLAGTKIWRIKSTQILATYFHRKRLMDVLEVHYSNEKSREQKAHFVFMKDRSPLAEQLAAKLGCREVN